MNSIANISGYISKYGLNILFNLVKVVCTLCSQESLLLVIKIIFIFIAKHNNVLSFKQGDTGYYAKIFLVVVLVRLTGSAYWCAALLVNRFFFFFVWRISSIPKKVEVILHLKKTWGHLRFTKIEVDVHLLKVEVVFHFIIIYFILHISSS